MKCQTYMPLHRYGGGASQSRLPRKGNRSYDSVSRLLQPTTSRKSHKRDSETRERLNIKGIRQSNLLGSASRAVPKGARLILEALRF